MTPEFLEILRSDFFSFVQKAYADAHGKDHVEGGAYARYLATYLQSYCDGEAGQLIVNLPPRHLKTFIFAVCLIAWELGHRPKSRVLVIAGSDRLANDILRQLRQLMSAAWYGNVFRTRLANSPNKTDLATTSAGTVRASSISGNFTGFGGDLIIVDDAADIADASDLSRLEEINEIFDQKVMSRRNNPAKARVVVIAHRLAEEDLSGHLLESEDWDHVCLPLIAEEDELYEIGDFVWQRKAGDLLRPNLYTGRQLEEMKLIAGSPGFSALHQQNPAGRPFEPIDPGCFGSCSGRIHETVPIVISVDLAQALGPRRSFSVAQVWAPWLGGHILVDQLRGQFDYDTIRSSLVRLCKKYLPSIVLIENNGWAQALASSLRKFGNTVAMVDVGGKSKVERLAPHVEMIGQGKIKISDRMSDRDAFVDEVVAFPNVGTDDQVDAMTQYLDYVLNHAIPPRRQRAVAVSIHQNYW